MTRRRANGVGIRRKQGESEAQFKKRWNARKAEILPELRRARVIAQRELERAEAEMEPYSRLCRAEIIIQQHPVLHMRLVEFAEKLAREAKAA